MLIITRQPNERLRINEEIIVKVTKVSRNLVSLEISAPKDISIVRSELKENITKDKHRK